ncbi:MAG: DHA2 family efflux MFS transporter permease subunit [Solirubrobacteraceae bacterium]
MTSIVGNTAVVSRRAHVAHRGAALAVVCAAALIVNVDNTILNVALPTLVRKLHATSSELQWIVDSYAMVFAGLVLVGGSLADRLGRKRFFLVGLTVFGVGSIGAAFSGSVDLLIAWRAVMGAGAALTVPSSLSIINDVFRDPAQRARAIGAWAATIGLGIAIGPIAGGLLLSGFWWGSIFLVNVPIVIAAFAGAILLVPDSKNPAADRPDPGGAVLSIAGLGLLLWAIIEGPTRGWGSASVIGVGVTSVAVLGAFVAWEARCDHPMLKLGFFRDRRFSVAAAAECLGVFGLLGTLFVETQFLQFDLGYSPLQAGLRILPIAAMLGVAAASASITARLIGIKFTAAAALLAIAGGLWQISAASTVSATYGDVLPGLLLIGFGAGLLLPTATNSVVGSVPQADSGIGSAVNTVALQVGGALGVAVIGSLMLTRYQSHISSALVGRHVPLAATHTILGSFGGALAVASSAGGSTGALLAHAARAAFMSGTAVSLAVGAVVALGGALLVLARLPSRTAQPSSNPTQAITTGPISAFVTPASKSHLVTSGVQEAPAAEAEASGRSLVSTSPLMPEVALPDAFVVSDSVGAAVDRRGVGARRWWALGALVMAGLAVGLDATVLSVALPTLARKLHASESDLQWFSSGYLLVLAAAMLPLGLLGDRYGRKKLLLGSFVLFAVGSVACAASPSSGAFVAARLLLGLAGAGLIVMGFATLPVLFGEEERPRAVGIMAAATFVSLPLGPILGGWLLSHYWWGWVFLINVPISLVGVIAIFALVPESRAHQRPGLDPFGVALSILGLVALIYGLIQAGQHGWSNAGAVLEMVCGIGVLVGFFLWERRLSRQPGGQPLLDVALFRLPSYTWGVILSAVAIFAMFGVLFTMPQFFQGVLGTTPMGSGLRLLPLIGGLVLAAVPADRIARLVGSKVAVAVGFAVLAAGLLIGSRTSVGSSGLFTAAWMALVGFGMGLALATSTSAALCELSAERSGVGSAALQAINKLGGPLGTAILGSVLSTAYLARLALSGVPAAAATAARQSIFGAVAVAQEIHSPALIDSAHSAFVHGMDLALVVSGAVALVGVGLTVVFLPRVNALKEVEQLPVEKQPTIAALA